MPVSLDVIAQISRAVAAEQNPHVERITVASTCAEAHRVELLVTLGRYSFQQRRLLLNLSRTESTTFERQLRARLLEVQHDSVRL